MGDVSKWFGGGRLVFNRSTLGSSVNLHVILMSGGLR